MPDERQNTDFRNGVRERREHTRRARRRRALLTALSVVFLVGVLAIGASVLLRRPSVPATQPRAEATPTAAVTATASASAVPTEPPVTEEPTAPAPVIGKFDADLARRHVEALAGDIGVRAAGTEGERKGARYIAGELEALGYSPSTVSFPLLGEKRSQNVIARLPGTGPRRVILGAHYDSKAPSPGANDNGSGSAALLAIAAELKDEPLAPTVIFVWFGDEEMIDTNQDHHHFGSRAYVKSMTGAARANTAAMISVDMIGYGPELRIRTMGSGPQTLQKNLLAFSKAKGYPASYLKDTGKYGWSDHEAFELAGIPAAWIEWRDDPVYHTSKDAPKHIDWMKVRQAGQLTLDYVRALDETRMNALLGE